MVAAALLGVGVSTAPKAKAANLFWDVNSSGAGLGGTGNWDTTSAYWTDSGSNLYVTGYDTASAKTFTSADTAFFYGMGGTATLTGNVSVGGLNFAAPSIVAACNSTSAASTTLSLGSTVGISVGMTLSGSGVAGTPTVTAVFRSWLRE